MRNLYGLATDPKCRDAHSALIETRQELIQLLQIALLGLGWYIKAGIFALIPSLPSHRISSSEHRLPEDLSTFYIFVKFPFHQTQTILSLSKQSVTL